MQEESRPDKEVEKLLFNQALRTAVEVSKAEAIVDLAFAAAEVAINATEKSSDVKLLGIAKETLNVARVAATSILSGAKKEAEKMMQLINQQSDG